MFHPIDLESKPTLLHYLKQANKQCCDYAFASLYAWASFYRTVWCEVDGFLICNRNEKMGLFGTFRLGRHFQGNRVHPKRCRYGNASAHPIFLAFSRIRRKSAKHSRPAIATFLQKPKLWKLHLQPRKTRPPCWQKISWQTESHRAIPQALSRLCLENHRSSHRYLRHRRTSRPMD